MGIFRKYALAAVAAMGLTAANASAALITNVTNNPLIFNWSYTSVGGNLVGNGSISVSGFNSNLLSLLVTINNTSTLAHQRLVSFGIGIQPNATSVSFVDANDGGMIAAQFGALPGMGSIEICALGGVNCTGGANGGLIPGTNPSDTFTIQLAGIWGSEIDIDPIGIRYQTNAGSFTFEPGSGCLPGHAEVGFCGGTSVPEPSSLPMVLVTLLSLMGFGYLGMSRRARA